MDLSRLSSLTLAVLTAIAAAACSSDKPEPATVLVGTHVATSTEQAKAIATSTEQATAFDPSHDPTLMMYAKFPGLDGNFEMTAAALESIRQHHDASQAPVLVDLLMVLPFDAREDITDLLHDLTGQDIPGDRWNEWVEWLGKHREKYQPPEGYAIWKLALMSQLDRRFPLLLRTAGETATIDLMELAWGGVPPDGIPDLQDPPAIPAGEAAYLGDDERVFGLSINGEHRAYPLRIINPHEMVNDTLGGEPIALSW